MTSDIQNALQAAMDREAFRKWLMSKPETEVVGRAASSHHCPIATYLKEKFPNHRPLVGNVGAGIYDETTNCDDAIVNHERNWPSLFIPAIDRYAVASGHIPAGYALMVLEHC